MLNLICENIDIEMSFTTINKKGKISAVMLVEPVYILFCLRVSSDDMDHILVTRLTAPSSQSNVIIIYLTSIGFRPKLQLL